MAAVTKMVCTAQETEKQEGCSLAALSCNTGRAAVWRRGAVTQEGLVETGYGRGKDADIGEV